MLLITSKRWSVFVVFFSFTTSIQTPAITYPQRVCFVYTYIQKTSTQQITDWLKNPLWQHAIINPSRNQSNCYKLPPKKSNTLHVLFQQSTPFSRTLRHVQNWINWWLPQSMPIHACLIRNRINIQHCSVCSLNWAYFLWRSAPPIRTSFGGTQLD